MRTEEDYVALEEVSKENKGAKRKEETCTGVSVVDIVVQSRYCTYEALLSQYTTSESSSVVSSMCLGCERLWFGGFSGALPIGA